MHCVGRTMISEWNDACIDYFTMTKKTSCFYQMQNSFILHEFGLVNFFGLLDL